MRPFPNTAYRPAVAAPGQRMLINIAATQITKQEDEPNPLIDYMGVHFPVARKDIVQRLDDKNLVQLRLSALVLAHDGRVSYTVETCGVSIRIHETNIIEVLS